MKLKSKYKVMFEAREDGKRVLYISEDSYAGNDDKINVQPEDTSIYKFFYEKDGKIFASANQYASADDVEVKLLVDDESIFEDDAE